MNNNFFSKFIIFLFIAVSFGTTVHAQYYLSGSNPSNTKWRQLSGRYYNVIYPKETDSLARGYLWLLECNRDAVNSALLISPKKIPVVINPYTVSSNGMVTWTPKRMELYTRTPVNGYAQLWQEQLALHESRHVGQLTHFTRHFYKPLSWFLGEQGPGLGIALHGARWLFEGDAVVAETALSKSGRGRTASFLEYYRAAFMDGDFRTWDRWRYGSYKDYAPNVYAFGYLILSTQNFLAKDSVMSGEILNYISRYFYNPNNLNNAFLKYGTAPYNKTLKIAADTMNSIWNEELKNRGTLTNPHYLLKEMDNDGYYATYSGTMADDKGNLYYSKHSYNKGYSLVKIDRSGRETTVRQFPYSGSINDSDGDKLYFTQTVQDPRWTNRTYSNLYSTDTKGKIKKIAGRGAYFSPTLQKGGATGKRGMIAAIESLVKGGNRIAILDAVTGERIKTVAPPGGMEVSSVAWGADRLYAAMIGNDGLGIYYLEGCDSCDSCNSRANGSSNADWHTLVNPQYSTIRDLHCKGDSLYFVCDADGVNNIYMIDCTSNSYRHGTDVFHTNEPHSDKLRTDCVDIKRFHIKRLTNSRYGAESPFIASDTLYFTELRLNGHKPVKIAMDSIPARDDSRYRVTLSPNGTLECSYRYKMAEELSKGATANLNENGFEVYTLKDTSSSQYWRSIKTLPDKRYSKPLHLLKFHSWMPFYFNADNLMNLSMDRITDVISPGATLYSQNTHGTAVMMLGYSYANGHHGGHAKFSYTGLYPVLEFEADINEKDRHVASVSASGADDVKTPDGTLVETTLRAYIPFNLSSNGWSRGLIPQIEWRFDNNKYYHYNIVTKTDDKLTYRNRLIYGVRYYQMQATPKAAIYPKWGIGVSMRGVSAINGADNFGKAASAYLYGYLPGVAPLHGLRLSAGYQRQFVDGKQFYQSNLISQPRGISSDIYADDLAVFSADYGIPVQLGDLSLGWFAYLQKLDITPFADVALGRRPYSGVTGERWHNYTSVGAELLLNGYFFHIAMPVSIGMRYAWNWTDNSRFNINSSQIALLFSVSFN